MVSFKADGVGIQVGGAQSLVSKQSGLEGNAGSSGPWRMICHPCKAGKVVQSTSIYLPEHLECSITDDEAMFSPRCSPV